MRELDVINTFRFIEPGPVLLVTTLGSNGPNVMTMGSHDDGKRRGDGI